MHRYRCHTNALALVWPLASVEPLRSPQAARARRTTPAEPRRKVLICRSGRSEDASCKWPIVLAGGVP